MLLLKMFSFCFNILQGLENLAEKKATSLNKRINNRVQVLNAVRIQRIKFLHKNGIAKKIKNNLKFLCLVQRYVLLMKMKNVEE